MNVPVSTKLTRLASRLTTAGLRHQRLQERIADVERRTRPDDIVLKRLRREKLRLQQEMNQYEGDLRALSRRYAT